MKQETVSGSGISWAICKSASRSRQITMPAPHHSSFLQAGCPSCCPTNSVKALKAYSVHSRDVINILFRSAGLCKISICILLSSRTVCIVSSYFSKLVNVSWNTLWIAYLQYTKLWLPLLTGSTQLLSQTSIMLPHCAVEYYNFAKVSVIIPPKQQQTHVLPLFLIYFPYLFFIDFCQTSYLDIHRTDVVDIYIFISIIVFAFV